MPWTSFFELGNIDIPATGGVIEVRFMDQDRRLHIGKSNNLRRRIVAGLRNGILPHSPGERMKDELSENDLTQVEVNWIITPNYDNLKRELQEAHIEQFGGLPRFDMRM